MPYINNTFICYRTRLNTRVARPASLDIYGIELARSGLDSALSNGLLEDQSTADIMPTVGNELPVSQGAFLNENAVNYSEKSYNKFFITMMHQPHPTIINYLKRLSSTVHRR